MARRFRFCVEYEGTGFSGWQVQPGRRTVQGELVRVFARIGEPATPTGAGRTDAGVHALANVAHVDLERLWDVAELAGALASLAPPDIRIHGVEAAGPEFHARHGALARTYVYALSTEGNVFFHQRRWVVRAVPPASWVRETLRGFRGPVDASSLARSGGETADTRCTIHDTSWTPLPGGALFAVTGNRFLHGMVRALVGTLLGGHREAAPPGFLEAVLGRRHRGAAGETAPARGLYLARVDHEPGLPSFDPLEVAPLAGLASPEARS